MADFTKLENIFRMVQPADLLVTQRIGISDASAQNSLTRVLQRLLLESGNGGSFSASQMLEKLKSYRSGKGDSGDELKGDKKDFDLLLNFYSTAGNIPEVKYPYMYRDNKGKTATAPVTFDQLANIDEKIRGNRDMSVILSNTPFVSPAVKDAQKAELFLNFLPSTVISRCVPYLELEFVFDRGFNKDVKKLQTAGLLKFLMGGVDVDPGSPNDIMRKARAKKNDQSVQTSAGMELFTSPQTLINMNPVEPGARYVDVLDPTRPFASIESVSINVAPTVGIMSYKHATVVMKLHDRSRLAEVADLIQPTTYTRTTCWLTYGWRHPYEPSGDSASETYADFINRNMLVKEAYGVKNASYSFDQTGQVSITIELYTKAVSELRDIKVNEGPNSFKKLSERINALAEQIAELRKSYKLDPPTGLNKEIRGFMILDAAEGGQFPDMKPDEIIDSIKGLEKMLQDTGRIAKGASDPLIAKLKELYKPTGKKNENFEFKEQVKTIASNYVKQKFDALVSGPDPFLIFDEKNKTMKEETGIEDDHPFLKELSSYNKEGDISKELKEGTNFRKAVVSFGKLFMVFMAPALFSIQTVDEFQILFYQLNDRAGKASSTNIAEFPIDLPVFLRQYKEVIEKNGTEAMTVEQFVKLAVDAQINDSRAIGYGFRSAGVFKPWDPKNRDPDYKDKKKGEQYESLLSSVNGRRGTFQMPQIEVYVEMTHERYDSKSGKSVPVDLLQYFNDPANSVSAKTNELGKTFRKISKIHVYDKTVNPYKTAASILRSDTPNGTTFMEVDPDPWVKRHTEDRLQIVKNVFKDLYEISTNTGDTGIKLTVGTMTTEANNQKVKHMVSKLVPSIIYGMNSSAVMEASLSTKQDSNLTAAQLLGLNSGKKVSATPAGGGGGGLPLKVIPAALSLRTLGCPILNYSQLFFIDFNTGTTIDNIYGISGLTHTLTPGKFESNLTMAFYDAYGKYEGAPQIAQKMKDGIKTTEK